MSARSRRANETRRGCPGWSRSLPEPPSERRGGEIQAYLIEELEDGFQAYYFDGFMTSVKRYHMTLLDGEKS